MNDTENTAGQARTVSSAAGSDESSDCFATECNPGYALLTTGEAVSDTECTSCQPGYYCPGGAQAPIPCRDANLASGESSITSVSNATGEADCYPATCAAGYGQYDSTTAGYLGVCAASATGCCVACTTGQYSDSTGRQDCLPHISCEAGHGIVANGTCEACSGTDGNNGTYNNASGLDSGNCHSPTDAIHIVSASEVDCAAGFYGTPSYGSDGGYTDGCTRCASGKYRHGNNRGTTDCFDVASGTVLLAPCGSDSSPCTECSVMRDTMVEAESYTTAVVNIWKAVARARREYKAMVGQQECSPCLEGSFTGQTSQGATSCQICEAGRATLASNVTACPGARRVSIKMSRGKHRAGHAMQVDTRAQLGSKNVGHAWLESIQEQRILVHRLFLHRRR